MPTDGPSLPLPPPLTSDEPGSWAYDTMSRRVRENILARIFRENIFPPEIVEKLRLLDNELGNAATKQLSLLSPDGGPDIQTWNEQILVPALENKWTWLSAPWALAEFYLYRRIMSAIDYFNHPVDPFTFQKELGLSSAIDSINVLTERVNNLCQGISGGDDGERLSRFQTIVLTSLWGNRMDLSIWPVGGNDSSTSSSSSARTTEAFSSILEAGQRMILSNDMDSLAAYVRSLHSSADGPIRMDIIVDNAGFELFCDLCLADFLICSNLASVVHIQLKAHPTFVSDAMAKDVEYTINFLQTTTDFPAQVTLGNRWAQHIATGKWLLLEHFFWVQPQPMWLMPDEVKEDIAASALVFVKGDANYRRLLGDLHWQFDTPFNQILSYFPAPVVALRTLKAELGCGMDRSVTDKVAAEDSNWLVAGKYGVVQFCDSRSM